MTQLCILDTRFCGIALLPHSSAAGRQPTSGGLAGRRSHIRKTNNNASVYSLIHGHFARRVSDA